MRTARKLTGGNVVAIQVNSLVSTTCAVTVNQFIQIVTEALRPLTPVCVRLVLTDAMSITERLAVSYRDPSGYVVSEGGAYKRVVTHYGLPDYEYYLSSGLHSQLVQSGLIPHGLTLKDASAYQVHITFNFAARALCS